jgi:hypothetical protein
MTRPIVRIHDLSTNEVIDREMNDAEFAQFEIDQVLQAERAAAEDAAAETKASGIAKLLALGLTEAEANALVK